MNIFAKHRFWWPFLYLAADVVFLIRRFVREPGGLPAGRARG